MTVKELNIDDVFRVVGETKLWRKVGHSRVQQISELSPADRVYPYAVLKIFAKKDLELVERADTSEIRRSENTLILKGGEVTLRHTGAWTVYRCTPGESLTEFVLTGSSFSGSAPERLTADAALAFTITLGSKHLGRPNGSEIFAYKGRVYGRTTQKEMLGKSKVGGYKLVKPIDGVRRLIIAGVLTLPGEFALYDIIQEHFGHDAIPKE